MDFSELIKPYSENGRTIGGQIKWLSKNGFTQANIDYAMLEVYKRIESGEKFKDGDALDQELRKVAQSFHDKESEAQMRQRVEELEWNKLSKSKKLWQVITGKA